VNISLEFLFHYRCESCNLWWSVADLIPVQPVTVCPHCWSQNSVDSISYKTPAMLSSVQSEALKSLLMEIAGSLEVDREGDRNAP